jgi:hypothetical protein
VLDVVTRVPAALDKASLTKTASRRRSMDQPTTLREKRSSTTQQQTLPSRVVCSVMSLNHSWLGAPALKFRLSQ